MSRPPSSSSSSSSFSSIAPAPSPAVSASALARVHGHDHNRPLPPPRLPEPATGPAGHPSLHQAPLTAPLTPLSSSSPPSSLTAIGTLRTSSRAPAPAPAPIHDTVRILPASDQDLNLQNRNATPTPTSRSPTVQQAVSEVTLTVPRPDGERAVNEYVETPFRPTSNIVSNQKSCLKSEGRTKRHLHHHLHHHHHHHLHHHHQHQGLHGRNAATIPVTPPTSSSPVKKNSSSAAVTKQPVSFTKEPTNPPGALAQQIQLQQQQQTQQQRSTLFPGGIGFGAGGGGGGGLGGGGGGGGSGGGNGGVIIPLDEGLSIMCEYCGRCRCESCREPPPLPSRWLCDNACFCSAETALDYASCLCCVKGLFYHCGDAGSGVENEGEGAGSCADEPCSCNGSSRLARWTCLGALALALPCLLCYWPLKGCVALCEACYARHASHGCRCDPSAAAVAAATAAANAAAAARHLAPSNLRDSRDPEKRLLDPVTPEL
ncbi:protein sprouty homolog 2-like [Diprion similis]|uniref:protein sprouty homolog 2-like n=1 Tax=Diprion similis TaxID=362088 RepID=UPI001EF7EE76|nr:protein sprouty homolog 2-like [Diprion similis]